MASVFAWRSRQTRHFGEQPIPYAELSLLSAKGRWQAFSVQVDTGAVVSVLPRSAGDLLGIRIEDGELIDLAGVSAPPRSYYIHKLRAKIGELPEFQLWIAVADQENVPNLLGRLDLIEHFRIHLEPLETVTRFDYPREV